MLVLEQERRELFNLEPLTRLWNRKKVLEFLEEELARGLRNFHPTGVLLFSPYLPFPIPLEYSASEIEKSLLQELSQQIKEQIRCFDKVGRFGRRESMVILPQTSSRELKNIGRRLSEKILLDSVYAIFGLPARKIILAGASSELFLHPSTKALISAYKRALAIALHLPYPDTIYILGKKEVPIHERKTNSS